MIAANKIHFYTACYLELIRVPGSVYMIYHLICSDLGRLAKSARDVPLGDVIDESLKDLSDKIGI